MPALVEALDLMTLPHEDELPVQVLSQLLAETTNSYKFLFLLAILDAVQAGYGDEERWRRISLRDLAVGMLTQAWLPLRRFRLSFGLQDRTGAILDSVLPGTEKFSYDQQGQLRLRSWLAERLGPSQVRELTRYVPKRLIRPFFAADLSGIRDSQVDARLISLARERFESIRPLYMLEGDWLELHPQWHRYLQRHLGVVRGWVCWHWTQYLQSRNPNVPAVSSKLLPLESRNSLDRQWQFWKKAMRQTRIHCIYSGRLLGEKDIALDHFLPWSFVAHDRLWNLAPVCASANSSKGDRVPAPSYLAPFSSLQAKALVNARPLYGAGEWSKIIEPYLADLHVPEEILNAPELSLKVVEATLSGRFELTIPSLMSLAACNGFSSGWTFPDNGQKREFAS